MVPERSEGERGRGGRCEFLAGKFDTGATRAHPDLCTESASDSFFAFAPQSSGPYRTCKAPSSSSSSLFISAPVSSIGTLPPPGWAKVSVAPATAPRMSLKKWREANRGGAGHLKSISSTSKTSIPAGFPGSLL